MFGHIASTYAASKTVLSYLSLTRRTMATKHAFKTLLELKFDNTALRSLPIDPSTENTPRPVHNACFSHVKPTPVQNPQLVAYSKSALSLLELDEAESRTDLFMQVFSGCKSLEGFECAAHCYCGHQFGLFSGQLGDGAAHYLGEVVRDDGERWELQIKGSGLTPYSRGADGRKVLRSTIREFLCSEAMHHLGIATTRAGSCITSDSMVVRDLNYDGNPVTERVTIVLRIARTFIRFGSFEISKSTDPDTGRAGPSEDNADILKVLLDYVIKSYYPEITNPKEEDRYLAFFKTICEKTAKLVAQWMCVGFCHGVLNTDNMSIVGATIDYGPYGFMDAFNPGYICNGSDQGGRYAYDQQPSICKWNLRKLSEALDPVISSELTEPLLAHYDETYQKTYHDIMKNKFGLARNMDGDKKLFSSFLDTMATTGADFTNSFRCLSSLPLIHTADPGAATNLPDAWKPILEYLVQQSSTLEQIKKIYQPRMSQQEFQMMFVVMQQNPEILELLQRGREQIEQEIRLREKQMQFDGLTESSHEFAVREAWSGWLVKYYQRMCADVADISEEQWHEYTRNRRSTMNDTNPKYILRNYIAQYAIDAAEEGDFSKVNDVLKLLEEPYSDNNSVTVQPSASVAEGGSCSREMRFDARAPEWAIGLKMT